MNRDFLSDQDIQDQKYGRVQKNKQEDKCEYKKDYFIFIIISHLIYKSNDG